VKLFYSPGACSLSPHIVLRELGLPFDLERVDTKKGKTASGADFARLNPKGYVPVLQLDDGTVLTEGPAIVQYLADRRPEAGLAPPAGSMERYRLQEWLNYVTSELHKSLGGLFNPAMPAEWKEATRQALARKFAYVSSQLEGRDHLLGASFTVADAYLFVILSWTRPLDISLDAWPVLKSYRERIAARPAVQAARNAEKGA
jgi:glutathione S-transferase